MRRLAGRPSSWRPAFSGGWACRVRARAIRTASSSRPGTSRSSTTRASGSRTSCCSGSPRRRARLAIDLVVDSDGFDAVGVTVARAWRREVERCHAVPGASAAQTAASRARRLPTARPSSDFCPQRRLDARLAAGHLGRRHFAAFCEALLARAARSPATSPSSSPSRGGATRRPRGTDYLELAGDRACRRPSRSLAFVADLALDAERFAEAYNAELAEYRADQRDAVRGAAVPRPRVTELVGGAAAVDAETAAVDRPSGHS